MANKMLSKIRLKLSNDFDGAVILEGVSVPTEAGKDNPDLKYGDYFNKDGSPNDRAIKLFESAREFGQLTLQILRDARAGVLHAKDVSFGGSTVQACGYWQHECDCQWEQYWDCSGHACEWRWRRVCDCCTNGGTGWAGPSQPNPTAGPTLSISK